MTAAADEGGEPACWAHLFEDWPTDIATPDDDIQTFVVDQSSGHSEIGGLVCIGRANTVLYCERWPETVEFYRSVLGLPVGFQNDWFVEFQLTSSSFLSIANTSRATIGAVGGQGVTLSWRVSDVAETRTLLEARRVDVTPTERRWGAQVCYCHDPEGHRIEFWSEQP